MLDGITAHGGWKWSAYGKHPAARDYFRIGGDMPLARAFSTWVEKGYARFADRGKTSAPPASWRFWSRESAEDRIACGILKDSADAVGRPYPFLIMGSGPLAGWGGHWDLTPFACEAAWTQMEYISARSFKDVKSLEAEIQRVKSPSADWRDLEQKRKGFEKIDFQALDGLRNKVRRLSEAEPVFCLDSGPHEYVELIDACHRLLRPDLKQPPNAVFMGGTVFHTHLAVFRKALTDADFLRLWSLSDEKAAGC